MRSLASGLLLVLLVQTRSAHADFVVAGPPPGTRPELAQTVPATAAPADNPQTEPLPAATFRPVPLRFMMAYGFGHRVPLRFAVRQIVPHAVSVTYGPGAEPDALVDWKGGQGWNWVLFKAVRPIGLRLVMSHRAVEIRQ